MSAVDIAAPRVQSEEGYRAQKYLDTKGNETIGYGFNIGAGLSRFAAAALNLAQLAELHQQLLGYAWYAAASDNRQSVFLDVAFNDGLHGLLAFPSMIHFASIGDWVNASAQLLDSDAARELPGRYNPLAQLLLNG